MKKLVSFFLCLVLSLCATYSVALAAVDDGDVFTAEQIEYYKSLGLQGTTVNVYNWGEYIDEDLIDEFEDEYGIEVIYDTFDTNEAMYPRVEADPSLYDVICPSDYMIEKMIQNDVLQEIDWDQITNKENIGEVYLKSCEGFDPGNKYCVPYTFGTVGILYNKELVDEDAVIDSWDVLWDETYKNDIIMQDSVRDAFMISLKRLGYSCNTTDEDELNEAMEELKIQSKLNKAYTIDEVRDKMINGAAAIGVIYSGEYLYCQEENEDLEYVIPKEGTNIWYDGWVIPKYAKNPVAASYFINFMCRPDIALRNMDFCGYVSSIATPEILEEKVDTTLDYYADLSYFFDPDADSIQIDKIQYPDRKVVERCAMIRDFGDKTKEVLDIWSRIKGDNLGVGITILIFVVVALMSGWMIYKRWQRYSRRKQQNRRSRRKRKKNVKR